MEESEIIHRCRELPERFGDRLSERTRGRVAAAGRGGEFTVMVKEMIFGLGNYGATITEAERDDLRALLEAMNAADVLDRLDGITDR